MDEPDQRKKSPYELHRCQGHYINYMRGTPAGSAGQCTKPGKVVRDGKLYCLLHDPERVKQRAEARDKRYWEKQESALKTFGFRVDGNRIYDIKAETETQAKARLIDLIVEVKIECLGELKNQAPPTKL